MNVKKIISVLLAMLIVTTSFSLLPVSASALETEETKETVITESGKTGDSMLAAEIVIPHEENSPNYPEIIKFENTNNGVMVSWTAFPGAKSYRLFYWNGEKWRSIGSTSELSYLHKNAENGIMYLYTVRAEDEWGDYCSDFNHNGYENVYFVEEKSDSESQSYTDENGVIFEEDTKNELVKKSGITGDCTWTLDDKGTLTISGNGAMGDYMYDNNTESEQIINLDYQAMFKCYGLNYWDFPLPTESGLSGDDLIFYDSLVNIASPINRTPWGTEIKSVIINDGVKSIGACAFLGCTELTKVSIPDSVNNIGDFAFFDCEKLASVTIPENMERIGQKAFAFSRQLRSITIPKNVKDIGLSPFEGCANLTNITVDKDNSYYDSRNDCNAIISKKNSALLSGCKSTIIPEGVMNIYPNAFFGMLYDTTYFYNVELKTINIPDSVENIGSNAFAFCNQLERVSIPSNVYIVNNKAFLNCTHLDYIDIANSRRDMEIGMEAFFGCNFSQITIPPRVNKIGEYAFGYSDAFGKNYYKIDNFAIKGKSGSEAQSFAKENGFRFIDTNFEWGIDNWRFDNKPEYFNYDINDNDTEIIQNIEGKFELSAKQKNDLNAWFTNKDYMGTGMCFGMTVSEIFARKGILKLSEYKLNDIINYNDINNSNTRLVISVIQGIFNTKYGDNYLQNLKLSTFNPVDYKQSDFLRNIETKLTNGNNLVMIGYKEGYKDSEKNNYHAVLGYGIEEGDYPYEGKNYNRKILIADPDYLSQNELKDEACIYYNSDYTSWVCPIRSYYWNDNSDSNAEIYDVLIDADSKDSPVGSGEGESENHYIAGISIYNKGGNQQTIEQVEGTGDPELNFTGDGSGIARYYIDGGNRVELYALWNPAADHIVKYSTPSDYNMKMDYEHVTYYANVENGKSTLVKPEGSINIKGSDVNYSITMLTDDSERVTDWYALTVSGNNTDEVTLKKHENGYILSSDNLQNIEIKAEKGDVEAVKTFSTTYNSVFIDEIDENTIGIKVDVDGDGTYETELSDVQNTYQIGDVNFDGEISIDDVTQIQLYLAELSDFSDEQRDIADVNGDGYITIEDATQMQLYLAELI